MKQEPKFYWDEEKGLAICELTDNHNKKYMGEAICHEDDRDMMSRRTGEEIAIRRAKINFLIHVRDNELKPALNILKELQSEMVHSHRFNSNSYESKSLRRKIHQVEFDLFVIKETLAREKEGLREYLAQKDIFYNQIRANRNRAKKD